MLPIYDIFGKVGGKFSNGLFAAEAIGSKFFLPLVHRVCT